MTRTEKTFEILDKKIQELLKKKGFESPTLIQKASMNHILNGENVLVIGPTGEGKTEACLLPIFNKFLEKKYEPIFILYITPLRSLNRDLLNRILWWAENIGMDVEVRHGDTTQYERTKQTEFPPHMLITTPETLQAILPGSRLKERLKNVKCVVIDEIHELVQSKRGTQLALGLERLRELCGDFQLIGLSATVGSPEKVAQYFAGGKRIKIINIMDTKALEISIISPEPTKKDIELSENIFLSPQITATLRSIDSLIQSHRSSLIFTNTREAAEVISSRLRRLEKGYKHDVHHSSLSKEARIETEKNFKEEKTRAIICTSSLELGIDIGSIDYIIQYQSPRQVSRLVQRMGRSGHRTDLKSRGSIISGSPDDIMESMAIVRKAIKGELEEADFHEMSWDVLLNQIIGLTLDKYDIDWKRAFSIIKRAFPYRKLDKTQFSEILNFIQRLGMIWLNAGIKRRRKAWNYYYENLSTIPDTYSYRVVDSIENREIGVLDEAFVAEYGEVGTTFIVKGRPWRILSIDSGRIFVEPVEEMESSIPAWEGEMIPVPFSVAQEVGSIRRKIGKGLKEKGFQRCVDEIKKDYPVSEESAKKVVEYIQEQAKSGKPIPHDENLIIEFDEFVVLHSCLGTKINETLSRFLAALLISKIGRSIAVKSDPYRIMIKGSRVEDVMEVLEKDEDINAILHNSIQRSKLFKWKFLQVAKRFGVIGERVRWGKINIKRIIESYRDSLISEETEREIFLEKLDVNGARDFLRKIRNREIEIKKIPGASPIAQKGLEYQFRELIGPKKPEKEIFSVFKNRLLKTNVRLVCLKCGKYSITKPVERIEEEPSCPYCESRLLTVIKPYQRELEKLIKKKISGRELDKKEEKEFKRLEDKADLVLTYGKKVIIALAGRGVGPETAIRILAKQHEGDDFFKDILDAERAFIKTKRYWS